VETARRAIWRGARSGAARDMARDMARDNKK